MDFGTNGTFCSQALTRGYMTNLILYWHLDDNNTIVKQYTYFQFLNLIKIQRPVGRIVL
jgi:hypothetical protein